MKKKRKLRKKRVAILALAAIILFVLIIVLVNVAIKNIRELSTTYSESDKLTFNELDYSNSEKLDIDLYSDKYMLIRLNDYKVLYCDKNDESFYPASLTKVVTLNTVLNNCEDLNDVSSYSNDDYYRLINLNASLAGLITNKDYTIEELLYALILPSGGDSAVALENYFRSNGQELVEMINKRVADLGLHNSHFTNPTGLHDDNLYTTLNDYALIVIDTLKNDYGRNYLKTLEYENSDNVVYNSTLKRLKSNQYAQIYGGKTGFTGEAGENITVVFSLNNRSYLLILANADGNPYLNQNYHFKDVENIIEYLYKKRVD